MFQDERAAIATEVTTEARLLAAVGYLPALFMLTLLLRRDDEFCRKHAVQSAALLIVLAILWAAIQLIELLLGRFLGGVFFVGFMFRALGWLVRNLGGLAVSAAYIVFIVMGMVQAGAGQAWSVPMLGPLAVWIDEHLFPKHQTA